jgi:hypothetical protein
MPLAPRPPHPAKHVEEDDDGVKDEEENVEGAQSGI